MTNFDYAPASGLPVISDSVGRGGKNRPLDVAIVQRVLNEALDVEATERVAARTAATDPREQARRAFSPHRRPPGAPPSYREAREMHARFMMERGVEPFKVDAVSSDALIKQIEAFQKRHFKWAADGKVSPGRDTITKMQALASKLRGHPRTWLVPKAVAHDVLARVDKKVFVDALDKQLKPKKDAATASFFDRIVADETVTDVRFAAYYISTVYHETAHTYKPVEEIGKGSGHTYGAGIKVTDTNGLRGKKGEEYENVYYGRGYVQLTWEENYKNLSEAIGRKEELHVDPDKALEADLAYEILTYWMQNAVKNVKSDEHTLGKYITKKKCDYKGARRIVNLQDKAQLLANYATQAELLMRLSVR